MEPFHSFTTDSSGLELSTGSFTLLVVELNADETYIIIHFGQINRNCNTYLYISIYSFKCLNYNVRIKFNKFSSMSVLFLFKILQMHLETL